MGRLKRIIALFIGLIITVCASGLPTYATYSHDDTFYNGNNILFYDSDFEASCSPGGGTTTSDKGNQAIVYNYFINKGLSSLAAAAATGNFKQESQFHSTAVNPSSGAYGLAQWLGSRLDDLKTRSNWNTLSVQLDYVWFELNHGFTDELATLKNPPTQDPSKLALLFGGGPKGYGGGFEGYADGEQGQRGDYATTIFKLYANGTPSIGTSSSCGNIGAGNFVYYSQTDPKWKDDPYGDSTIGIVGCGPTSLAMIIATFFDKSVTPDTIAKLGDASNAYVTGTGLGTGTDNAKLLSAASKAYSFSYTDATGQSMDSLIAFVKGGGLAYIAGNGAAPFTTGGHVVVIRGVTSTGDLIIADPYRGETDTYKPSIVQAGMKSIYEVSKS